MSKISTSTSAVVVSSLLLLSPAVADPTCSVSPDRKKLIVGVLCGQNAAEKQYRKTGTGCIKKSVTARLQDSAVQIHIYRMCGFKSFSEQLKEANIRAMKFMEMMAICSDERLSLEKIMEDRMQYVAQRAKGITCSKSMRSKMRSRRPYFQSQIEQSKDTTLLPRILSSFKIPMDSSGNIFDAR